MHPILIVPGYENSGPDHWQTLLARKLGAQRVEMPSWTQPDRDGWVTALDRAVAPCAAPPVLVAHSLGCVAVAHWAGQASARAAGALLVAPCDVERPGLPAPLRSFAPLPRGKLDFESWIAASSDDPYLAFERAQDLAHDWGSRLIAVGALGHINVAAGLGPWPAGEVLLAAMLRSLPARTRR